MGEGIGERILIGSYFSRWWLLAGGYWPDTKLSTHRQQ